MPNETAPLGAQIIDRQKGTLSFRVFAYNKEKVSVVIKDDGGTRYLPLKQERPHLFSTLCEGLGLNFSYKFILDEQGEYPDPYSHYQPFGVHGYSQPVDHASYPWKEAGWTGKDLEEMIIMEIHVGTFTRQGTFRAAAERLDYLVELGVNAIELMPLTQTPGRWNWGYDGTNLFSVNHVYGSPDDLKHLVESCHRKGLAIILDVVYNHFGPEGTYLGAYGPYFTEKHLTPWGPAVNYDDEFSRYMRRMVLDSVRHWLEVYRFDGLRLDAVHAIKDDSPRHILQEFSDTVKEIARRLGRKKVLIAETDQNDVRTVTPVEKGGFGMDAQWMDDFHHSIHTVLTGEKEGYYADYGRLADLPQVFRNFLYTGQYSRYLQKPRGTDASAYPGKHFVVAIQNHDQVGNRAQGDRLAALVDFPYLKAAAGLLFFSPYVPMLFMGEEYGETRPFLFFTDYGDSRLKEAVSRGRREEFSHFTWHEVPDPQDPETFLRSKLTPEEQWTAANLALFRFYRDLITLRTSHPVLRSLDKNNIEVRVDDDHRVVVISRWKDGLALTGYFNLGLQDYRLPAGKDRILFASAFPEYGVSSGQGRDLLPKGEMIIFSSPH